MSLDHGSYDEKRDFIRMPVDCAVSLSALDGSRSFTAAGKNLSAGGALFYTEEILQPGDALEMHIETGGPVLSVLDASVEVVRVEPLGEHKAYAVGVAITRLHP